MTSENSTLLKVNEPYVVHETLDGEAIIMHLGTGNYYSIEWPGTILWDVLSSSGSLNAILQLFDNSDPVRINTVTTSVHKFVESLISEQLLIRIEDKELEPVYFNDKTREELLKTMDSLDKLLLNKYTDMKDLLLLDPIHEVDDKGWPKPNQKQ